MPPAELHQALTNAVQTALRELAAVECSPRDKAPAVDLTAALPVVTAGGGAGVLALAMPDATVWALARRVLVAVGVEPDAATAQDCAGEAVNVIAGQAKTMLTGTPHHFTLCTPEVTAGPPDLPGAFALAFDSDVGPFALHARL
jgi:CheY-specific phosphatase CheX